jgi:tight adherence protein B
MALVILSFVFVQAVTFVAVMAAWRRSPKEEAIAQRMALIHIPIAQKEAVASDTEQLLKATRKTRFGWLDEILTRYPAAQRLHIYIAQSNSSVSLSALLLSSAGFLITGYGVVWFFAPVVPVALAGGVALACLPLGILTLKRSKRIKAFNTALPECIEMLARALRAGHSIQGALETLSENVQEPAATEFAELFRQQNLGLPLRDALLQLLDRVPSADLRVLVTAILVQKETGGNLVEILDRTVFVIRERLRIEGEIQVQTAQGRLTGWILSALPIIMMIMLNLVNPGYSSILFHDPLGRKLLYYGLGMLAIGSLIIRQIINGIEV